MTYKFYNILFLLLISSTLLAQHKWVEGMYNSEQNFYETQKSFEEHWEGKEITKGKGWKQFKRWEAFMEPRVYPDGIFHNNIMAISEQNKMQARMNNNFSSWEAVGPTNVPLTNWGQKRGVGRINAIAFHPANENIIWVGTPAGGLWKTTDGGLSWSNNTDQLPSLGIAAISIDPNNSDIMYLASGDRDGGDTYAYGILKSFDGGATWNTTGLSFNYSSGYIGYQILINPDNSNIINASVKKAGSGEVYRSIDGGENWTTTLSGQKLISMQQHPSNPNIIYGGTNNSGKIYKSIDNGTSWSIIMPTQGIPSSGGYRVTLAVTDDNPDVVYALISNTDGGFFGLYKSSDSGENWILQSNTPNLLNWSSSGEGDNDGQGWYDLALTVSPTNENEVYVGGVNTWKSTDGGLNWSIDSHWYGSNGVPYKHADEHTLKFHPNGTLYSGNDGGLYKKTGSSWTDISDGLQITQFYSLGVSQNNPELVIAGAQDNGTLLMNGNESWSAVLGGDGMECLIDHSDDNIMYAEYYYGDLYKSNDGGNSFNWISPSGQEGAWETPYIMDPNDHNTLYIGYDDVWKTTDGGGNWFPISNNLTNGEDIHELAVAPSNNNILYASRNSTLYKTIDSGNNWEVVSSQLPNKTISYISIHPTNSDKLWVSMSGFTSNQKVYTSEDGGQNWTNISYNLPNLPANCIIHKKNSNTEELFLATDIGIYYKNANMNEWMPFNQGLPNVIVRELEIQYSSNTLYAATYGRGVWKSSLEVFAPSASFSTTGNTICQENCVEFSNTSSNYATEWQWSFQGGNPESSSIQNPTVCYSDTGEFNVSLIVSNSAGADTIDSINYLNVILSSESNMAFTTCDEYYWNGENYTESGGYSFLTQNSYGCDSIANLNLTLIPNTIGISQMFLNTINGQQIGGSPFGGIPPYTYEWSTGDTTAKITPTENGSYWLVVNDNNLCADTSYFEINSFHTNSIDKQDKQDFTLFPNPTKEILTITAEQANKEAYNIKLLAANGKVVMDLQSQLNQQQKQLQIDISKLSKGPYFVQLQTNNGMVYKKLIIQ